MVQMQVVPLISLFCQMELSWHIPFIAQIYPVSVALDFGHVLT